MQRKLSFKDLMAKKIALEEDETTTPSDSPGAPAVDPQTVQPEQTTAPISGLDKDGAVGTGEVEPGKSVATEGVHGALVGGVTGLTVAGLPGAVVGGIAGHVIQEHNKRKKQAAAASKPATESMSGGKKIEKGAFHKWLGKKEGEKLTDEDIEKGLKSDDPHVKKMAQFAKNFKGKKAATEGLGGAVVGGIVGSAVLPVVGTVAGAVIGHKMQEKHKAEKAELDKMKAKEAANKPASESNDSTTSAEPAATPAPAAPAGKVATEGSKGATGGKAPATKKMNAVTTEKKPFNSEATSKEVNVGKMKKGNGKIATEGEEDDLPEDPTETPPVEDATTETTETTTEAPAEGGEEVTETTEETTELPENPEETPPVDETETTTEETTTETTEETPSGEEPVETPPMPTDDVPVEGDGETETTETTETTEETSEGGEETTETTEVTEGDVPEEEPLPQETQDELAAALSADQAESETGTIPEPEPAAPMPDPDQAGGAIVAIDEDDFTPHDDELDEGLSELSEIDEAPPTASEEKVDETEEVVEALESMYITLQNSIPLGGLNPIASGILYNSLDHLYSRAGITKNRSLVSLEAFNEASDGVEMARLAMEDISDQIGKIYTAIAKQVKSNWMAIKDFFDKLFITTEKLKTRALDIQKRVKEVNSGATPKAETIENERLAQGLKINGKVPENVLNEVAVMMKLVKEAVNPSQLFSYFAGPMIADFKKVAAVDSVEEFDKLVRFPINRKIFNHSIDPKLVGEKAMEGFSCLSTARIFGDQIVFGVLPNENLTGGNLAQVFNHIKISDYDLKTTKASKSMKVLSVKEVDTISKTVIQFCDIVLAAQVEVKRYDSEIDEIVDRYLGHDVWKNLRYVYSGKKADGEAKNSSISDRRKLVGMLKLVTRDLIWNVLQPAKAVVWISSDASRDLLAYADISLKLHG